MLQQLREYAAGDSAIPCLVSGPPGAGKSATLACLVQSLQSTVDDDPPHARPFVFAHFVGASPGSSKLRQLLQRLCLTLTTEFGLEDVVPTAPDELSAHFQSLLARAPRFHRIVLVLDALEHLDGADDARSLSWLPRKLPANVKIVASCTDQNSLSEPVLLAFASRPVHRVLIPPLEDDERRQIIRVVPSLSAKTLDDLQVDLLLANPATANPLFLLVALEELRGFGSFEDLDVRIATFPHPIEQASGARDWLALAKQAIGAPPQSQKWQRRLRRLERVESALVKVSPSEDPVAEVFHQVIDRLETNFDSRLTGKVLSLLASVREDLSEGELRGLLLGALPSWDEKSCVEELQIVLRQLRAYLMRKGPLIDFYHDVLRKAVRTKYLFTDSRLNEAHSELAKYFRQLADPAGDSTWTSQNPHAVGEYPWQLLRAGEWAAQEDILTTFAFLQNKVTARGPAELLDDYEMVLASPACVGSSGLLETALSVARALRRCIHVITQDADALAPQMLLWQTR